jgi:hypothetical protein
LLVAVYFLPSFLVVAIGKGQLQNRHPKARHLQIYECRNWETEHFNSVSEITVSFQGIHKWEPNIYK